MPTFSLSSPIIDLPHIGPAKAKQFEKLNIVYVRDLLFTFPRRYDDFSRLTPIAQLEPGQTMTVHGRIKSFKTSWGFRGRQRLLRIYVDIKDDTGVINVTWYNLRFLEKQLWQGREIYVAGTVELNASPRGAQGNDQTDHGKYRMRSPVIEFSSQQETTHTGRITPIYPETYGVTSRFIRYQVKNLLPLVSAIPEYIPSEIMHRQHLISIHDAIREVHFPQDADKLAEAQRRLRFDELFFLQLAAIVRRQRRAERTAFLIPSSSQVTRQFIRALPFKLTQAQQTAIAEISKDLNKTKPMNRLLQGDVGSGKSVIALHAALHALRAGHDVMYLAPTEVLARQQHQLFSEKLGATLTALLIGSMTKRAKEEVKSRLSGREPLCVIGTHALLQNDIVSRNCALVIVDEQHRFGVAQRRALQEPSDQVSPKNAVPHLLSMTATPIPRTLNLTVYGDLDISVLDELPPGRKTIKTKIIAPGSRDKAIMHILTELHQGRQAYVIAPLIEESDKLEAKSAQETFTQMQALFPDIAVGLLHGRMTSQEKAGALNNFTAGAIQLLVSTSVVEVGVNVPNASIMIIEGAERFGLAQLHQFRGRIGRGSDQAYCYLFPTTNEAAKSRRLKILADTNDGFVIAEEDLKLRGPGEVYGVAQSGFGNLKVASLLDYATIKVARAEAAQLLADDPELSSYPILQKKVMQKNRQAHFE